MPLKKSTKNLAPTPAKSAAKTILFSIGDQPYIELNKLMKLEGLTETGGEAGMQIMHGKVKLNGNVVSEKRKKVRLGDIVFFGAHVLKVVE